jgi:hypothetical protein
LVMVGEDGLVHAAAEAREGFAKLTLNLTASEPKTASSPLRVEEARSVVVAPTSAMLDLALAVPATGLRAIAPTVAVSTRVPTVVAAMLRGAGVTITEDVVVPAQPGEPALPTATEAAVGPRPVRMLLERALDEGRQVRLEYFASSRGGAATDRIVDPWTFRDDLLRGYCHLRSGERTFAVDRIGHAWLLPTPIDHAAP